jgi:hypothetical protein
MTRALTPQLPVADDLRTEGVGDIIQQPLAGAHEGSAGQGRPHPLKRGRDRPKSLLKLTGR